MNQLSLMREVTEENDFHLTENLLRRTDRRRNIARFYLIALDKSLFGEITLERRWGRIGTHGHVARTIFLSRGDAEIERARILAAKLRRGYRPASTANYAVSPSDRPHG